MTTTFLLRAFSRACGFVAGWSLFTGVLLLATRPLGIGPGFSQPLPYAAVAILVSASGHGIRRWLNESPLPPEAAAGGAWRRLSRQWLRGLRLFFKGTAAFNNFILLSIAYILGIGLTSLFMRKQNPRKPAGDGAGSVSTYWRDLDRGKREADAYFHPY